MTKKQMVDCIIELFNKNVKTQLSEGQCRYIVYVAIRNNTKEYIEKQYQRILEIDETQYTSKDIVKECEKAIWELTYIHICPCN